MKNIFKIVTLLFSLLLAISCEDVRENPITKANGFTLRTVSSSPSLVLNPINDAETAVVIEWDRSDNGVASEEPNYQIEVAQSGTDFAIPFLANLGSTVSVVNNVRSYTFKVKEINVLANKLSNFVCGQEMSIDIRIKSKLGDYDNTAFIQYSTNTVTVKVTPYSSAAPILSFSDSEANASTSKNLAAISIYSVPKEYEGYVYLQPGSYKFYQPDACGSFTGATTLGGAGGVLSATGAAINIATAGYYLIKANLTANTYAIKEYKAFGIFGTAVRTSGSALGTPMISNNDNKWSITIDLFKGRKFKFKAGALNSAIPPAIPTTNVVSALGKSSTGQLSDANPDYTDSVGQIIVPGVDDGTKVSCTIKADLSNPRNYTYKLVTQ